MLHIKVDDFVLSHNPVVSFAGLLCPLTSLLVLIGVTGEDDQPTTSSRLAGNKIRRPNHDRVTKGQHHVTKRQHHVTKGQHTGLTGIFRPLWYATVALLAFGSAPLSASEATSDVTNSRDFDLVKRFPRSHIIQYERQTEDVPYRLILGSLKKVNNVLSPKKSEMIVGKLTSITYRIPDGSRSDEVADYFVRRATESEGTVLFTCQGRECGSSNYWANTIFRRAGLYGPEQLQNFTAVRFAGGSTTAVVSIYTAQRGNKRLYAHLDIVETKHSEVETKPQTLLNRLLDRGVFLLSGVAFNRDHQLTAESRPAIAVAAAAINMQESLKVYVVGHLQGTDSLQSLVDHSTRRAEQVASVLIEEGVEPARLSAHGVGPFAPLGSSKGERIELVLAP